MDASSSHPYVTIAGAAHTLAVDEVTIRRWIASGKLGAIRVNGHLLRIPRSALDALTGPDFNPDEWLSIADAATLYGVSEWTVRRWIQRGQVVTRRPGARVTRISVASLTSLAEPVAIAVSS